jgi:four helix bundle protein
MRVSAGMAKRIEDLPVYQKACAFSVAVTAILQKPTLRKDFAHRNQIADAIDSIESNMEEGFEQGTDRAFARYLTISKGSTGEVIGHLRRAKRKGYITADELTPLVAQGNELGRMLGGFIKYLRACDWKGRGSFGYPEDDSGDRTWG